MWHIGVLAAIGFLIFFCVCWPTGSSVTVAPVYFLSIGDFGCGSEIQKLVAQQVDLRISIFFQGIIMITPSPHLAVVAHLRFDNAIPSTRRSPSDPADCAT